jgi:hypothetical protein
MLMLIPNWRDVVKKAWSMRLMALAGALSGLEFALPYLDGLLPIPPGIFAAGSAITVGAAFVARIVAQKSLQPREPGSGPEEYPD